MARFPGQSVVVTGAGGFIGGALTARLLAEGDTVHGVIRSGGRKPGPLAGAALLECDLRDAGAVEQLMQSTQATVVFHLASSPDGAESFAHGRSTIDNNLLATLNLLEAFRGSGRDGVFVYGDSCKSYGNVPVPYADDAADRPNSSYAITKAAGWSFCKLYAHLHGFATVSVRPTLLYGPGQGFNLLTFLHQSVRAGREVITLMGGQQTRDPLYIDDAIEAYLAAARKDLDQQSIPVGGGQERTVQEIASRFVAMLAPASSVACSDVEMRPTEILRSFSDNRMARRLMNWYPQMGLDEGFRRTIAYLDAAQANTP